MLLLVIFEGFNSKGIFILKNILIVPSYYSEVSGSYLPFPLSGAQIKYGNLEVGNKTQ